MAPMGGCHVIPGHVTGLYLFAVINLILLLNITFTEANILVLDQKNRTIGKIEHLYDARFGPRLMLDGVWGHIAYTHPNNGCSIVEAPPETATNWIAIIKRGGCDFDVKVLHAQVAGFSAAIVFNNESDDLIRMGGGTEGDEVRIPSVFIGITDGKYLVDNFDRSTEYSVLVDDASPFSFTLYLVPFAIVMAVCIALMLGFFAIRFVRDCNKRRRSRLSKSHLRKIPVKKFKKGDDYDICAICIDEYEEGEKLRILPCSHAYHQKCIDPWLTKNKKTCPICKRKVIPGRDGQSGSESSSMASSNSGDENQPLLPAQDLNRGGGGPLILGGASMGGTFDNPGLPANFRSAIMRLPPPSDYEDDEDDEDDDDDDNIYHPSVEVHTPIAAAATHATHVVVDEALLTDNDGAVSEAASSIFGGGGAETEEDEVAALIEAAVGAPEDHQTLDMLEDHFNPADEGEGSAAEKEKKKEEVKVVPGNFIRKKKRGGRVDDANV